MNINVTKTQVSITNEYILNDKEYNVNRCYFTFSEEYTNDLVKKAIFVQGTSIVEEPIINNECMIPSEVLNRGTYELRVYAYQAQDEELVLRYSPTPTLVYVRAGSYIEGAESPEVITPSQFEQYMQALNDGLNEVANVDIDAEQLTNGVRVTITDRTGTEKTVYVYNATINGLNTLNIVAGTNIEIEQEDDTLTINNTYDDTQIKQDIQTNTENISNLGNGLADEITNRKNADNDLQEQIDGISASSDVKDIVGTYQDLVNYDTQHLGNNDIVKVLQDSTHNNAMTYYRWDKSNSQWIYIGQEGPYYTKSESDDKFVEFTDYATSSKGGVIKVDQNYGLRVNSSGTLIGYGVNYNDYQNANNQLVVDKGTLENVITGKNLETANNKVTSINSNSTDTQYPSAKCVYDSQESQNALIQENANNLDDLERLVDYNSKYANALIKNTNTGTELTINDTAECPMPMELQPSVLEQATTTGANLQKFTPRTYTSGGNNYVCSDNGQVTYTNTSTNQVNNLAYNQTATDGMTLDAGTYTLKVVGTIDENTIVKIMGEEIELDSNQEYQFTLNTQAVDFYVSFRIKTGTHNSNFYVTLASGNAATTERYTGSIPAPNPDYPQDIHTISGNNTINIKGRNLFDKSKALNGYNRITNGEYVASTSGTYKSTDYIKVKPNNVYYSNYVSFSSSAVGITFYDKDKNFISGISLPNNNIITIVNNAYYMRIAFKVLENNITDINTLYVISGNQPLANYIPYQSQTFPLNLGDLEYCKIGNYADEFYLATESDTSLVAGKWYLKKNIWKHTFDGTETITYHSTSSWKFRYSPDPASIRAESGTSGPNYVRCTIYRPATSTSDDKVITLFLNTMAFVDNTYSDADTFKTMLAQKTPTVYYVLATPSYTLLNDTLQSQLTEIYNWAISYQDQTNISQVNDDLPFVISATTVYDLNKLLTRVETLEAEV